MTAETLVAGRDLTMEYRLDGGVIHALRGVSLDLSRGDYVSIKLASLDDVDLKELIEAPVRYANGRDNKWWEPPAETRHL